MLKDYLKNSNLVEEQCPICGKNLRYKAPCCSDKNSYLVCPCGFKKVLEKKNETAPVHHSGGSADPAGVQG
ncbi:MAG TPA: hypothetical protein PLW50_00920 [Smithellaceae bacterium]|nr:hypothetical protein [Smithellaceae bacterium]